MGQLHVGRVGFAFGLLLGLMHAGWSALVWAGKAQALLDFYFKLHFLSNPLEVQAFSFVTASTLVGITFGVGFVIGMVFGIAVERDVRRAQAGAKKAASVGARRAILRPPRISGTSVDNVEAAALGGAPQPSNVQRLGEGRLLLDELEAQLRASCP